MRCDHKQIPAPGPAGRVRGCLPGCTAHQHSSAPRSLPSPNCWPAWCSKSSRTSTTAAWPSTSWTTRSRQPDRDEDGAALHHLPEGRPATAPGHAGSQDLRRGARTGVRDGAASDAPAGGRRRHRAGVAAYQPVPCQAPASSGDRDQITTYAKYPKVVFVVDCSSHMILAAVPVEDRARTWCNSVRRWGRQSAVPGSRRSWPTRTSTPSGSTAVSGRTAFGRSSRPARAADRQAAGGRWRRRMKQRFGRYKRSTGKGGRWRQSTR